MKKKILMIFSIGLVILFLFSIVLNLVVFPKKYKNYVVAYSDEYNLDKALVYAVIKVESDFKPKVVSKSGALGLMQILPSTAMWIAEELDETYSKELMFQPQKNIRFGCFYLRYLFDKFDKMEIVICAYNAGEGKVFDWIENGELIREKIDYEETKKYLTKVENFYQAYSKRLVNL